MFGDIEEKYGEGEVTVESGINYLLVDGYEVNDNQQPAPENKPTDRGGTDRPIYKYGWTFNGIDGANTATSDYVHHRHRLFFQFYAFLCRT